MKESTKQKMLELAEAYHEKYMNGELDSYTVDTAYAVGFTAASELYEVERAPSDHYEALAAAREIQIIELKAREADWERRFYDNMASIDRASAEAAKFRTEREVLVEALREIISYDCIDCPSEKTARAALERMGIKT